MALKKCKECGKEVSTKADKCPSCGCPLKSKGIGCLPSLIIIIVCTIFIGKCIVKTTEGPKRVTSSNQKEIEQKQNAETLEAKQKRAEELKKADDFISNMEQHYQKMISSYKNNKIPETLAELDLFKKYNDLAYKDTRVIYNKIMINNLEKEVKNIPSAKVEENLAIYKKLLNLAPDNPKYKRKVAYYEAKNEENERKASSDLELLSWSWSSEHGYVTAEGQVRNISGRNLKNVEALVSWYDKNENMITSDSSIIEYNPIINGQISPFKVMERYNPAMKSASIEFKYLFGGKIPTYKKK